VVSLSFSILPLIPSLFIIIRLLRLNTSNDYKL
jgi:hypothetical protein